MKKSIVELSRCLVNENVYYIDTYRRYASQQARAKKPSGKVKTDRERVAEVQKIQFDKRNLRT